MAEPARILVVDDEPAVQTALSRALAMESYDVAQAADGEEALERLGAGPFEAVILDVAMPRDRRARGLPPPARGRRPHPRADADRAGRESTIASRASTPAPTTTSSSPSRCASCSRACARCCAAPTTARRASSRSSCFEDLLLDRRSHEAWRGERLLDAHPHRVPAAGDVHVQPAQGADALGDLRARVGL